MKCALVIPSITDFYFTPHRAAALGAKTAANEMQALGHEVQLFDFASRKTTTTVPLPAQLQYLEGLLLEKESGPAACFTRYRRFGPAPAACAQEVADGGPWDIIFVSSFAFAYAEDTAAFASEMKRLVPSALIAAGGAGATVLPEWYLQTGSIDYVLPGDAEQTVPALFSALPESTPSTPLVTGSSSAEHPVSDHFCEADRAVRPCCSPARETSREIQFSASISRGCPKNCSFCPGKLSSGPGFRRPELSEALHAVISTIEAYQPNPEKQLVLNIEDDNLLADPDFCFSFLQGVSSRFPAIQYTAENGMDYLFLDGKILDRLIDAGFRQFNFSAGILDENDSQLMKRPFSISRLEQLVRRAADRGVRTITYFIPGHLQDTPEKAVSALVRLMQLPGLIGISPFYAVPGLPGFQNKERFLSHSPSLCKGSSFYPWNNTLTSRQLMTLFRLTRLANSLRAKNLPEMKQIHQELLQSCLRDRKLYTINAQKGKEKKEKTGTIIEVPGTDTGMIDQFFSQSFHSH